jgi:hypothetical protein
MTLAEWFQEQEKAGNSPTIWLSNEGGYTTLWLSEDERVTIRNGQFSEIEEAPADD